MVLRGRVHAGVITLPEGAGLPDGTEVTIVPHARGEDAGSPRQAVTIWDALSDLGRWAEGQPCTLPADLAANHDYYLHGLPKRQ